MDMKPVYVPAHYRCPACERDFDSPAPIEECAASMVKPQRFVVGDFVLMRLGYSWFDGDPDWVGPKGVQDWNGERMPEYPFIFVVTHVEVDGRLQCPPEWRYSLATRALRVENPEKADVFGDWWDGWNVEESHRRMPPAAMPRWQITDAMKRAAARLLGQRTRRLL